MQVSDEQNIMNERPKPNVEDETITIKINTELNISWSLVIELVNIFRK